jgi:uncharacterized protein
MVYFLSRFKLRRGDLKILLRHYKVRRTAVFGSYATGKPTRSSDIDFLVDFENDADLCDQAGLKMELEERCRKKVDLVTPGSLNKYLRAKVLKEAVYL